MTFDIAGITNEKNDEYLNLAGGIQVAVTSNRSVMGSINLVAEELISLRLNINQTINREKMVFYSNYIHTRLFKKGYRNSAEALRDALNKPLKLEEVIEGEPYSIEKSWNYSELSQLDASTLSEQQ